MSLVLSLTSQVLLAACFSGLGTWLALWLLTPSELPAAWPERARRTWASRTGAALATLFFPIFATLIVPLLAGPLRGPLPLAVSLCLVAAIAPVVPLRRRFDRALHPEPERFDRQRRARGRLSFLVVLYGHLLAIALLALVLAWLPVLAAVPGAALALVLVVGWARGWGLDLARALGLARDAPPELSARVVERARAQGIELRGVELIDYHRANAFALPLGRRIAFTAGALEVLDPAGLLAVADHELGHVGEPRAVIAARVGVACALVPLVAVGPVLLHFGPFGALGLLVAVVLLLALGGGLRRRMELRADAHAHREDPAVYARALEALYRFNRAPAVLGRGPHPDLYDRMVSAGVEPDWPRPEPPSRWWPRLRVGAAIVALAVVVVGLRTAVAIPQIWAPDSLLFQALWGGAF